jgi:hypothetical protein
MRCTRYVDEKRNKGLGSDLKWPSLKTEIEATCSGLMIPEYTSAALTNFIWGACMPSHLFSLSTDAGQEDHVSMSGGLAVRLWETLPRLAEVLAIELAMAGQAAGIRKEIHSIPTKIGLKNDDAHRADAARASYEKALDALYDKTRFEVVVEPRLRFKLNAADKRLSRPANESLPRSPGCSRLSRGPVHGRRHRKLARFVASGVNPGGPRRASDGT